MENIEKEITFAFNKKNTEDNYQAIKERIVNLKGITGISKSEDNKLTLCYNPYLVSESYLVRQMKNLNFKLYSESKKETKINRWLRKMAEANKKNFGSQPLDCCELKSKQN